MSTNLLAIIGLSLDIIGVIIVFFWGLPFKMPERELYVEEIITEEQKRKDKVQKIKAYVGLSFILSGFILQLLSYIN